MFEDFSSFLYLKMTLRTRIFASVMPRLILSMAIADLIHDERHSMKNLAHFKDIFGVRTHA